MHRRYFSDIIEFQLWNDWQSWGYLIRMAVELDAAGAARVNKRSSKGGWTEHGIDGDGAAEREE